MRMMNPMQPRGKTGAKSLLEEVLLRAHIEMISETKKGTGNNANVFLRDVAALHGNTTRVDLPDYLKSALPDISHGMLAYIHSQGFVLVPKD